MKTVWLREESCAALLVPHLFAHSIDHNCIIERQNCLEYEPKIMFHANCAHHHDRNSFSTFLFLPLFCVCLKGANGKNIDIFVCPTSETRTNDVRMNKKITTEETKETNNNSSSSGGNKTCGTERTDTETNCKQESQLSLHFEMNHWEKDGIEFRLSFAKKSMHTKNGMCFDCIEYSLTRSLYDR